MMNPPKYKSFKRGSQVRSSETGFHDSQGVFARKPENERMDQYAKPGTSAAKRQADPYETSFPSSRYRSQRP